jgi:glycosyltransferase involved in cell wall biosynthesis
MFLIISKLFGKKVIIWGHGIYGNEDFFSGFIKTSFLRLGSHVLLYGNHAKDYLIHKGFPEKKISVVFNSLNHIEQLKIRKGLIASDFYRNHFGNENPIVVFTGRIEKVKKIELLIKACYELKTKNRPINIILIGDGREKRNIEFLIKELNIENNVWLYGPCYDEPQLGQLIFNADLCVSPGNVGLTAIHSLTYGTPVVTHNNFSYQMPEFEAITKGITGDFFNENNLDSLVNTLQDWFTKYPVKPKELIEACHEIVDKFYNPHFQLEVFTNCIRKLESPSD